MAETVEDHYANHLGPVYTWMIGDIDAAFSRSDRELDVLPLLKELADRGGSLPIRTIHGNLLSFRSHTPEPRRA